MAKKIYSIDELSSKIDEDLSWRKKELQYIKTQIPDKKSSKQDTLLRSAIPILYAHWEGFVKMSAEFYLKFVASKYIKHSELKPQFIALSLAKLINDTAINNIESRTAIIENLLLKLNKSSNIPTKNIINTKSNLNYSVFKEIIYTLSLSVGAFSNYESYINDLVDTRNHIAHGNQKFVDYKTCIGMFDDMFAIMETLKNEILNSAVQENYKIRSIRTVNEIIISDGNNT